MRFDAPILAGPLFAIVGAIFLVAGLLFIRENVIQMREIDHLTSLPVLNSQFFDVGVGTEALVEGKIAERNPLLFKGFVAYLQYEYQGERCTTDDDGNRSCEEIWIEDEHLTPDLWLDLKDGRTHLLNSDYAVEYAPITWQSSERLVENETRQYRGFRIGNPILVKGTVVRNSEGGAIEAEIIYGGSRQEYLTQRHRESDSFMIGGLIFSVLGGLMLLIGLGLIALTIFGK